MTDIAALRSSDGPLGVTHVVLSLDFGGLERVVLALAKDGRERGHRVSILCLERPGTLAAQAEGLGVEVVDLRKPPGLKPEVSGQVRAVLRGLRPDVVHTHQIGALLYAGPAARRERIPLVVHTEHGNHASHVRTWQARLRLRMLWRLAGRHASRFFCVSDDIAGAVGALGAVPRKKIRVIPNGIDTAAFADREDAEAPGASLGIAPGEPVVGTVGRLVEVKRQDLLIRAFARALGRHPGAHLLLVGDGPLLGELRGLAADLGVAGRVHFVGYQAEPERFLRVMNVFALPSRTEGMPLAVLEAWASGLPVVASKVGGLPKLIEHGRTGLLFEPGDESALAEALSGLIAGPELARRMGEAGRARARSEFDVRVMALNYEGHYREAMAETGVPA